MVTFFEQAGVNKENEKAADRRSGQCPRNSEQLHPAVGGFNSGGARQPSSRRETLHLSSQTRTGPCSDGHVSQHSFPLCKRNPHLIVRVRCDGDWDP